MRIDASQASPGSVRIGNQSWIEQPITRYCGADMSKKDFSIGVVSTIDLPVELYSILETLGAEAVGLSDKHVQVFNEVAIEMFLTRTHGALPSNKMVRKQMASHRVFSCLIW